MIADRESQPPPRPLLGPPPRDLPGTGYRRRQIARWLYVTGARSLEEMSNLPAALRRELSEQWRVSAFQAVEAYPSEDGSTRYLFTLLDGVRTEAVLMPYPGRMTICLSSQAGCPAGCTFCATGRLGLVRNLDAPEILDQLLAAAADFGVPPATVRNVVFMGMGEPLLNPEAVFTAIHRLVDRDAFGLSPRRITLSTVGIPRGIRRLADENLGIRLALSLHAPDDQTRRRIIPTAHRFDIAEIMEEVRRYQTLQKRRVTFEYTLLEGLNDHLWQADRLAELMTGLTAHVNLIPWNPWSGAPVEGTWKRASGGSRNGYEGIGCGYRCAGAGEPTWAPPVGSWRSNSRPHSGRLAADRRMPISTPGG